MFAGIVVHFILDVLDALVFNFSVTFGLIFVVNVVAVLTVVLSAAAAVAVAAVFDIRFTVGLIAVVTLIAATFPDLVVAVAFRVARLTGALRVGVAVAVVDVATIFAAAAVLTVAVAAVFDIRFTVGLIAVVTLIAATFPDLVVAVAFRVARLTGALRVGVAVADMAAAVAAAAVLTVAVAADLVRFTGAAVVDDDDDTVDLVTRLTGVLIPDVAVTAAAVVTVTFFPDLFAVPLVLDASKFWTTPSLSTVKANTIFSGLTSSRLEIAGPRGRDCDQTIALIDFGWCPSLPISKKEVTNGTYRRKCVITCILFTVQERKVKMSS